MNSCLRIILALLLTLSSITLSTAVAQRKVHPTVSENQGDFHVIIQEFGNAEAHYMDVLSSGSVDIITFDRVNIKLATTLYNIRRYAEAEKRFETVFVRNKKAFTPEYATAYVSTLTRLGRFQRAIEVAAIFSEHPLFIVYKPLQNLREGLKHQAELPLVVPYKVYISPINLPGSSYAATHYDSEIMFVHHHNEEQSLVKGAQFYTYNGSESTLYDKIPYTLQAGPAAFDKVNNRIIFTDNRYLGKGFVRELKDQQLITNLLRLLELRYNPKTGMWEEPKDVFKDKAMFSICHPALANNSSRMYFSANFTDAVGGMDLYMCNQAGNGWSKPIHLGNLINTKDTEMYPHVYGSKLYFVSNGLDGLGEMDIYHVELDSNGMPIGETLKHLPYPINTIHNDYAFIHNNDGSGYFSSDRPEGRNLDTIYEWIEEEDVLPDNSLKEGAAVIARPNQNAVNENK